jgi:diaminohydroxyphosphoribosylaminopyrimidine deaminase/5-amino-6-(5-phosphoribosylamino)uracil reductase
MTSPPIDLENDQRFMNAALALGRRSLGLTAPNPSVGALVVKNGIVLGRGWTAPGGRPHAETAALAEAGAAAKGATIYVTLEPCSHHGRTPPCCEAIVAAGTTRLVYAIEDPNPEVAGRGAAYCRAQGLDVTGGISTAQAKRDHRGHILRMTEKRPMVTLKLSETADGYVAGGTHDPRLSITGAPANGLVHIMRAMHDAIMIGIGTALADDPLMTVRLPGVSAKPLRVVLDSNLRLPPASRLARTARDVPVLLLTSAESLAGGDALQAAGIEIAAVPVNSSGQIDLGAALRLLGTRGLTRIFSEGGPRIGSALIAAGLADEVALFTAPKPLARKGVPTLDSLARAKLNDPAFYLPVESREIGSDRLQLFERRSLCSQA